MSDLPTAYSPIVIDRVERSRGDGDTRPAPARGPTAGGRGRGPSSIRCWSCSCTGTGAGSPRRRPATRIRRPDRGGRASRCPTGRCRSSTAARRCGSVRRRCRYRRSGRGSGRPSRLLGRRSRAGAERRSPRADAAPAHGRDGRAPPTASRAAADAEAGRAGPLADALLRETVSALHAELEQRSGREAALDGALERARAELVARTASQAELEATQGELRDGVGAAGRGGRRAAGRVRAPARARRASGPRRSWRRPGARPTSSRRALADAR